jgi:TolB protein
LAYDSDVAGNDEIYVLPADGGPSINVTNHPAEDRYPAWSPDGQHLAFQSNRDGNWEIYSLALETKQLTRL